MERQYYGWEEEWPTADDEWSRDLGRVLYFSWGTRNANKVRVPWAEIAAGQHDAAIDARGAALAAFGGPVIFSFNHEPEDDKNGTAAEFIAAYRRIHERFVAAGATDVTYAWTMMAWSFRSGGKGPSHYPGDDVVDVIAADGYNWFNCPKPSGSWRSFKDIFNAWHNFGAARGKPMMIAEWGSNEDPSNSDRKGQWITAAAEQLKQWTDIEAALYFHTDAGCPRWLHSSQSSLDAYRAMAADPYFNPGSSSSSSSSTSSSTSTEPPPTSTEPPPTTTTPPPTSTTPPPTSTTPPPTTTTPPPTSTTPPPPGSTLFSEDFETGLDGWSPVKGVTTTSADPLSGSFSARAQGSSSAPGFARATIGGGGHTSVITELSFKMVSQGSSKVVIHRLLTGNNTWLVGVFVQPNGSLGMRNDPAGSEDVSSTAKITIGQVHQLRLELEIVGGIATARVFLDGTEVTDIGFTGSFGSNTIGRVQVGDSLKRSFDLHVDDLVVTGG